jgi:hypothetical protein
LSEDPPVDKICGVTCSYGKRPDFEQELVTAVSSYQKGEKVGLVPMWTSLDRDDIVTDH